MAGNHPTNQGAAPKTHLCERSESKEAIISGQPDAVAKLRARRRTEGEGSSQRVDGELERGGSRQCAYLGQTALRLRLGDDHPSVVRR